MSNRGYEQHATGIVPHDRAPEKQPRLVAVGSWRRSLPTWACSVCLVCLTVTGISGLSDFTSNETAVHDRALGTEDQPGGGTITRSEMRDVWVFPSLIGLAKGRAHSERINSFEDIKRSLELRGQERLWYAVTFRAHQANGRAVDMTFVRHPYRDPGHFPELELILDAVAEVPPRDGTNAPLPPTVQLLPETLLVRRAARSHGGAARSSQAQR